MMRRVRQVVFAAGGLLALLLPPCLGQWQGVASGYGGRGGYGGYGGYNMAEAAPVTKPWDLKTVFLAMSHENGKWKGPQLVVELLPPQALISSAISSIRGDHFYWPGSGYGGSVYWRATERERAILMRVPELLVDMAQTHILSADGKWTARPSNVKLLPYSPGQMLMRLAFPLPPRGDSFDLHIVASGRALGKGGNVSGQAHYFLQPLAPGGKVVRTSPDAPELDLKIAEVTFLGKKVDLWQLMQKRTRELARSYHSAGAGGMGRGPQVEITRVVIQGGEKTLRHLVGFTDAFIQSQGIESLVSIMAVRPKDKTKPPVWLELYFPHSPPPEQSELELILAVTQPDVEAGQVKGMQLSLIHI